jgi:hypothetical protein
VSLAESPGVHTWKHVRTPCGAPFIRWRWHQGDDYINDNSHTVFIDFVVAAQHWFAGTLQTTIDSGNSTHRFFDPLCVLRQMSQPLTASLQTSARVPVAVPAKLSRISEGTGERYCMHQVQCRCLI